MANAFKLNTKGDKNIFKIFICLCMGLIYWIKLCSFPSKLPIFSSKNPKEASSDFLSSDKKILKFASKNWSENEDLNHSSIMCNNFF